MPEPGILSKIRQEIDFQFDEWSDIVSDNQLVKHYQEVKASGKLSRPPKGYEKDNPAIEWLKYKGYYTQKMLSEKHLLSVDFLRETIDSFQAVKPMIDFINGAMQ